MGKERYPVMGRDEALRTLGRELESPFCSVCEHEGKLVCEVRSDGLKMLLAIVSRANGFQIILNPRYRVEPADLPRVYRVLNEVNAKYLTKWVVDGDNDLIAIMDYPVRAAVDYPAFKSSACLPIHILDEVMPRVVAVRRDSAETGGEAVYVIKDKEDTDDR